MNNLKNKFDLIDLIGIIIVTFIIYTLASVTIELFANLDYLNRLF